MPQQKGFKRAQKVEARKRKKVEQERAANFRRMDRAQEVAEKEQATAGKK